MTIENRIEVAAQMSNAASRQALNCMKGNRRRTYSAGGLNAWGYEQHSYHSFERSGAIAYG